jgi:hypothetical protein
LVDPDLAEALRSGTTAMVEIEADRCHVAPLSRAARGYN